MASCAARVLFGAMTSVGRCSRSIEPRRGRRLAGAGRAEQHDVGLTGADPAFELVDRLRLVTARLEVGDDLERGDGSGDVGGGAHDPTLTRGPDSVLRVRLRGLLSQDLLPGLAGLVRQGSQVTVVVDHQVGQCQPLLRRRLLAIRAVTWSSAEPARRAAGRVGPPRARRRRTHPGLAGSALPQDGHLVDLGRHRGPRARTGPRRLAWTSGCTIASSRRQPLRVAEDQRRRAPHGPGPRRRRRRRVRTPAPPPRVRPSPAPPPHGPAGRRRPRRHPSSAQQPADGGLAGADPAGQQHPAVRLTRHAPMSGPGSGARGWSRRRARSAASVLGAVTEAPLRSYDDLPESDVATVLQVPAALGSAARPARPTASSVGRASPGVRHARSGRRDATEAPHQASALARTIPSAAGARGRAVVLRASLVLALVSALVLLGAGALDRPDPG